MSDEPRIGELRIVEDRREKDRDWPWRYTVERYCEGGKFLFWSWEPKWVTYSEKLTYSEARAHAKTLREERTNIIHPVD